MNDHERNWNDIKGKLGLPPAIIFWVVSLVCFIFGLAFENQTGFSLFGVDIAVIVAFTLGIANTMIQIVGNGQDKDDMGILLWLGWMASYAFGVGSNINYLYSIISIGNPYLKFMICGGLGMMIEVMPERLLVEWLKTLKPPKRTSTTTQSTLNNRSQSRVQPYTRPDLIQSLPRGNGNQPKVRRESTQVTTKEPTYHPIQVVEEPDVPDFLKNRR